MLRLCSERSRSYPGRPARRAVQLTLDSVLHGDMHGDQAGVSRGHSSSSMRNEGPNLEKGKDPLCSISTKNPSGGVDGRRVSDKSDPNENLLEQIISRSNMLRAWKRVKANKGAPGIDNMPVADFMDFASEHWDSIRASLLAGTYQPLPVKRVEIPKPTGGTRPLGIPTVLDRLIQQAIAQVLQPIFDPHFSESSFGFRPGRSAHNAVHQVRDFIRKGYRVAVDADLSKFFDTVVHDVLMCRVARRVRDKRVLRLIGKYLRAGVVIKGRRQGTRKGVPQGGPLSPLLANILLDDLDKELEKRGHCFARYADDFVVLVKSDRAGKRVKANKGAPGIDNMPVADFMDFASEHWDSIRASLLAGTYQPLPVKRVEIPKPTGGTRPLGIPTVLDRLIQQAIAQVLQPIFDPHFSESSFGFRPGRSAHNAVHQVRDFIRKGYRVAVDADLSKFFDTVVHDVLMCRVARRVRDKRVLRLIGKYLRAGVVIKGRRQGTRKGVPQGGPLSPLLANILLDDLDKELEKRGHRFARYADDFVVLVKSYRAGNRVMASICHYLGRQLKLSINREKSKVGTKAAREMPSRSNP